MTSRNRPPSGYINRTDYVNAQQRLKAAKSRDIGKIPRIRNPRRKSRCQNNFLLFCQTYLPNVFQRPFSNDHLKIINRIQQIVLNGGQFCIATPRGFGKTSICIAAVLWALLYNHRRFAILIGPEQSHAEQLLNAIRLEIEQNDLLLEDFPAVCYPFRRLEGIVARCKGQTTEGVRTHIHISSQKLVFPTIKRSPSSGNCIRVTGLTGQIRGMTHKTANGEVLRPDLILVDDPQTDESARSPAQCDTRERLLNGAVLGLPAPGTNPAIFVTVTVICKNDLADRLLNREKNPFWNGEKLKLVYSFPKNEQLWNEYRQILEEQLRNNGDIMLATEFYRQNQQQMDEGAVVSWDVWYTPPFEISAIQHAMNLKFRDEIAFFAEYQNEPLSLTENPERTSIDIQSLTHKLNHLPKGVVPANANYLTGFIDLHENAHYYMVCAWDTEERGWIVDYGTFPDQNQDYFILRNIPIKLTSYLRIENVEQAVIAGLHHLLDSLFSRQYEAENGEKMVLDLVLVDANWGQVTNSVYAFIKQATNYHGKLLPSHGKAFTATSNPISTERPKPGVKIGQEWKISPSFPGQPRHVIFDANYWKTRIANSLAAPIGSKGNITIFGDDLNRHRLLLDHLRSEYGYEVTARGRTIVEWKLQPGQDNHWLDCLVGNAVAVSICNTGVSTSTPNKPKVKFSELQRQKWAELKKRI